MNATLCKIVACLFLCGMSFNLSGQIEMGHNKDEVFKDYIRTVQLYPSNDPVSFPAIPLDGNRQLVFRFDDLEADVKRYFYTIVHCDADWKPSSLAKSEYIDGFDMQEIYDYEFSRGTIVDYTHYHLRIPNRNFRPMVSGNYLLQIFDPELDDPLVLTRRFVVYEPLLSLLGEIVRPVNLAHSRTHQEINSPSHKKITHSAIREMNCAHVFCKTAGGKVRSAKSARGMSRGITSALITEVGWYFPVGADFAPWTCVPPGSGLSGFTVSSTTTTEWKLSCEPMTTGPAAPTQPFTISTDAM